MIVVGIDVAKDKHDCIIVNSEGTVLFDVFTVSNTLDGFNILLDNIKSVADDPGKIKVGLEATGHYSSTTVMTEWNSEAQSIFDMPSTTQPNTSAPGTKPLLIILPRSEPKTSSTTLLDLMPLRNLCGSFCS